MSGGGSGELRVFLLRNVHLVFYERFERTVGVGKGGGGYIAVQWQPEPTQKSIKKV